MVGSLDNAYPNPFTPKPDSTPKTENNPNIDDDKGATSYRELYNESKGNESVFTQKVINQYGYSEKNEEDTEVISQIFGFLKISDEKDGLLDGKVTTQQLIIDLENEKMDVEQNLRLSFEHNYGADIDVYNSLKTEKEKDDYLRTCLLDNAGYGEQEIDKLIEDIKNEIKQTNAAVQLLEKGILDTRIDEEIEKAFNEEKPNDDTSAVGGFRNLLLATNTVIEELRTIQARLQELNEQTSTMSPEEKVELGLLQERQALLKKFLSATNENVSGFGLQ